MAGSKSSEYTVSGPRERYLVHRSVVGTVGSRYEPIVTAFRKAIPNSSPSRQSHLESPVRLAELPIPPNEISASASRTASMGNFPRVVALAVASTRLQANGLADEITSREASVGPNGTVNCLCQDDP